jgi:hypothetical protein
LVQTHLGEGSAGTSLPPTRSEPRLVAAPAR